MQVQDPLLGRVVNGYHIDRRLGAGAHGSVYGATEERTGRRFALKFVNDQLSVSQRLVEPALLSRLEHPGIVRMWDYFLHGQHVVMVMEWVEGGSLRDRWESDPSGDRRWPAARVRELLAQLGRAISYAHSLGILHRDIKLENVLCDDAIGRFVLADFGIARLEGRRLGERRRGGTPRFMAPEQILGRPEERSDLWALGIVAYFLRCGHLPFEQEGEGALRQAILHGRAPPLSERGVRDDDPTLDALIMAAVARSSDERLTSVPELLACLGAAEVPGMLANLAAPGRAVAAGELTRRHGLLGRLLVALGVMWCCLAFPQLQPLNILGLWLVYRAHRDSRERTALLLGLGAYAVLSVRLLGTETLSGVLFMLLGGGGGFATVVGITLVVGLTGTAGVWYLVPKFLTVRRQLLLRGALTEAGIAGGGMVAQLREYVDVHTADVRARVRFAEELSTRTEREVADAAVECRLALEHDPFNFDATLLLVHCYRSLGLTARARSVCEWYLSHAPQAVEFVELLKVIQSQPAQAVARA